ncbi:MAG: formate dehydrogenase subunit alpha [Azospirillum sp.]|nr:formate dehydrogenase subunit alpha [Azospirillum sp.]
MTGTFELDGRTVEIRDGETIWSAAKRLGTTLPHLCHAETPGYRPDGNCRACVVEIEGERALAASCLRKPTPGMKVSSAGARAQAARKGVIELLLADQPARETAHDPNSRLWFFAEVVGARASRYPAREAPPEDSSHPAMRVNLDACINCNLCVRACREVQVNDVIGMAGRGHRASIVFDFGDPMGASTCVACGECVQACPTGALMPATRLDDRACATPEPARKVASVCPYCGVGCRVEFGVAAGRIVEVKGLPGPANESRLCVKGRFGFDYVAHPHRLTVPLIRREDAPKNAEAELDPANPWTHFREAGWDEALDRAAAGFRRLRDAHGGQALAGFGSAKCSNEEAYLFQKLVRTGFGTNNVDHCTRLCHSSSVAALFEGIGSGAVTAPFTAVRDADVIVVIGANPTENHPVAATFFKQAAKRGAKLIVMDPRGMALKRHAWRMLAFKPGRDVAMLGAMLHTIVAEGLYDRDFVAARVEDFARFAEEVAGMTPEAMAPICGIDADTLREVARTYANAKSALIFWGMGVSQHAHGTDNARCLVALALLTGQIGRPGAGLHPLRGQNNVQGASDAGLIPMMLPDYHPVGDAAARERLERLWGRPLDSRPGVTVVEIVRASIAGSVKGMYILGENPAMSDPDAAHARDALAALEHLVVQDIFLTETAWHADVVLPAAAWPEKDGTVTNTNRQIQMGRAALDPPGAAKPDWWIVTELAKRLGLDWRYAHPRDVFAEMTLAMDSLANIDWARLDREGTVTYPCAAPDSPGQPIVFGDRFPTASGKGRLVPARLSDPAEPTDAAFPLVLITGRQLEHWHTGAMTRRAAKLDAIEPGPSASLARSELARLGIAAGARVRLTTRRGTIELAARADDAVPPGAVFVPFAYAEAAANLLTNPALDPVAKIPEFKNCAVRVEPV